MSSAEMLRDAADWQRGAGGWRPVGGENTTALPTCSAVTSVYNRFGR